MKADIWAELTGIEPDCGDCIHQYYSGKVRCSQEDSGLECDFEGVMTVTGDNDDN